MSKVYGVATAACFSKVYIVFNDAHHVNIKNEMLDVSPRGVNVHINHM